MNFFHLVSQNRTCKGLTGLFVNVGKKTGFAQTAAETLQRQEEEHDAKNHRDQRREQKDSCCFRNMLREGIPTATIARVTGLPRQKLAALRKK